MLGLLGDRTDNIQGPKVKPVVVSEMPQPYEKAK